MPATPALTIRKAVPDDIVPMAANIVQMALESEGRALDENTLKQGILRVFEAPDLGTYWVVELNGQVIANTLITTEWSDWNNAPYWWFQSVYIQPEWRGKGIWKALYSHIEAEAQQAGVCELRLYVEIENARAIRAYEKTGMKAGHYLVMEKQMV